MLNFIKWVLIILTSMFLAWLIPLLFWGYGLSSINSLSEKEKNIHAKEITTVISSGLKPVMDDIFKSALPKIKPVTVKPKVSRPQYTKSKKSNVSIRDKACNDAIFRVMRDKSKKAKEEKIILCSHNTKS